MKCRTPVEAAFQHLLVEMPTENPDASLRMQPMMHTMHSE